MDYMARELIEMLGEQRRLSGGDSYLWEYAIILRWPTADGTPARLEEDGAVCLPAGHDPGTVRAQIAAGYPHPRLRPDGATGDPAVIYFALRPVDDADMADLEQRAAS